MVTVLGDSNTGGIMARRRRSNTARRVVSTPTLTRRLSGPVRRSRPAIKLSPLQAIEDRRQYHPEGPARPARSWSSARHRLVVTPQRRESVLADTYTPTVPVGVSFEAPRRVAICVRRKQRREVLHALMKTGRGSRHHRKPRKSYYSEVNCT